MTGCKRTHEQGACGCPDSVKMLAPGTRRLPGYHLTMPCGDVRRVTNVERFILAWDPSQLALIRTGRPDIVNDLVPPNVESLFPRCGQG
jgi:hypothetical protein